MRGLVVLAAAIGGCALVLWLGPAMAERLLPLLGDAGQNMAWAETLFAAVIFGALLMVALAGGAWAGLNPLAAGRDRAAMLAAGILVGASGVVVATIFARLAGGLGQGASPTAGLGLAVWGSAVILFAAATEEIYFRGWLQPALARDFGLPVAITISALAFAALHLMGGARSPTTLVNLFLGGLLFGLLAARSGGLAGAAAAHAAWNWSEQIGLGLDPNPGVGSFGAFVDLELKGKALWGGSDEGLNASLGMTIALCALLVPVMILTRRRLVGDTGQVETAAAK
jgi:hypothetical protein